MTSIRQAVYDAWFEKADATDADAAKAFGKVGEDLKRKQAAEAQAQKDFKADKDHSRSGDVSETGGWPSKWEGEENPPVPKDQRGPNRPRPYKRDIDF